MKYNVLNDYENYLTRFYTPATAKTYKKAVDYLLKEQSFLDCRNLDADKVMIQLKAMKYKNQYSKYKNAFIKFCEFQNIELKRDFLLELELLNLEKKRKKRVLKHVDLKDILNHLKVIKDKKLKLSFETMLNTGLRVSEISQIKKKNCILAKEYIEFSFVAKGGMIESVTLYFESNPKLFNDLKELIENTKADNVFYSANYLQTKAEQKGFCCHDLRRAFAKLDYQKHKNIKLTMKALRHKEEKNTKIYINSKVKV